MKKISTIALIAAVALGLSLPAFAQASTLPGGGGGGGGGGSGTPDPGCQVDCGGGGGDPGEPFDPENPGGDPGEPGDDPEEPGDGPGDPGQSPQAELKACEQRLSSLSQMSGEQIASLSSPSEVSLFPICEAKSLAEVQPILVDKGNAEGLEGVIKSNELITGKLKATAYKPDDVVGIEFDADGNATLYVHKRG